MSHSYRFIFLGDFLIAQKFVFQSLLLLKFIHWSTLEMWLHGCSHTFWQIL